MQNIQWHYTCYTSARYRKHFLYHPDTMVGAYIVVVAFVVDMDVVSVYDNHPVNPFGWTYYLQPVEVDVDNIPVHMHKSHFQL